MDYHSEQQFNLLFENVASMRLEYICLAGNGGAYIIGTVYRVDTSHGYK